MGSISMSHFVKEKHTPAYKITKAALNMLGVQWSYALESDGFTVLLISPGVSTFNYLQRYSDL
jgi:NAD(P)-dependent dehydrogenase (short-subunit alcohol dehydrogenase family)